MMNKLGKNIHFLVKLLDDKTAHYLDDFDCSNKSGTFMGVNYHIKHYDEYAKSERFYIVIDKEAEKAICVYSLKCTAVASWIKEGITFNPAVEIAIFAVDREYQDIYMTENKKDGCLSDFILCYVISQIKTYSDRYCAAEYIMLYALDSAVNFYKRSMFKEFTPFAKDDNPYIAGCKPMYLPLWKELT